MPDDLPEDEREAFVAAIIAGWRGAELDDADRALCEYAEKLTLEPATMTQEDVDGLRAVGFDDVAIHDAIQVISYFAYINRVADAIHVELEPEMAPYPGE